MHKNFNTTTRLTDAQGLSSTSLSSGKDLRNFEGARELHGPAPHVHGDVRALHRVVHHRASPEHLLVVLHELPADERVEALVTLRCVLRAHEVIVRDVMPLKVIRADLRHFRLGDRDAKHLRPKRVCEAQCNAPNAPCNTQSKGTVCVAGVMPLAGRSR